MPPGHGDVCLAEDCFQGEEAAVNCYQSLGPAARGWACCLSTGFRWALGDKEKPLPEHLMGIHLRATSVTRSCLTPRDPMDYSLPGSSVRGISQQEYWSRLPFPSSGDLPDWGIETMSPALAEGSFTTEPRYLQFFFIDCLI